jgi:hypothetical protein
MLLEEGKGMSNQEMAMIKEVYLNSDPSSGNRVILKEDAESKRYFMMFVGDSEFAAIAKEKGLFESHRPLTHELYLRIMTKLGVEFMRIEIYDMKENTFYANVVFKAGGEEHLVDSRPSDAVALALNRKIPILINPNLFRKELTEDQVKEYEGIVKTVKF